MKSLMLKSLTIVSLLSSSLLANANVDKSVMEFQKKRISSNKRLKVNSVDLYLKKDLEQNGWYGYVYDVSVNMDGKEINVKDILFSNGEMIAPELINIKTNKSFKKLMYPTLSSKYYNDSYRIAGEKDAKHKIVVFSDPLCPVCNDVMPELIKDVQKVPQNLALYYIHMPLQMHPMAKLIIKAGEVAKSKGVVDVDYKIYTAFFDEDFNPNTETDVNKVLKAFNKKLNTNVTLEETNKKELNDDLEYHLKLSNEALIQGTPTLFFDGEIDPMRNAYKKYLK